MTDSLDIFAEDTGVTAGDNLLSSLRALVLDLKEAQSVMAKAEDHFNTAKAAVKRIVEKELPELMDEAGQSEITTLDGYKVTVKEIVRASIKVSDQPRAFGWLIKNGHERLIQRQFTFKFANNQDKAAVAFEQAVLRLDELPDYDDKKAVHASTLSSFVKTELEAGRELPLALLGVHRQRVATVK